MLVFVKIKEKDNIIVVLRGDVMPKFSIVIPVYNVEDYIGKCLDSIKKQTFKDYEVIVVDDGTKDNSMETVKKYPYTIIKQKNQGLSMARNNAVKKATGEYLIFLDSDDYWDKDLLKEINKSLDNDPDLVRFQIKQVDENNNTILYNEEGFKGLKGEDAFNKIVKYHFVENAWAYCIKRKYWLENKFEFAKGKIHEDFGLMPLVIIKANNVNSIEYAGYNYFQRTNSIMNNTNYEKTKRKVEDFYSHYKWLKKEIEKTNIDSKVFKSFIANSMIQKICELDKEDYKKYRKKLIADNVYDDLLTDTTSRKIKKVLVKISPKIYYKIKK